MSCVVDEVWLIYFYDWLESWCDEDVIRWMNMKGGLVFGWYLFEYL